MPTSTQQTEWWMVPAEHVRAANVMWVEDAVRLNLIGCGLILHRDTIAGKHNELLYSVGLSRLHENVGSVLREKPTGRVAAVLYPILRRSVGEFPPSCVLSSQWRGSSREDDAVFCLLHRQSQHGGQHSILVTVVSTFREFRGATARQCFHVYIYLVLQRRVDTGRRDGLICGRNDH